MDYAAQATYGGPPPAYMDRVHALEAGLQELEKERQERQARFNATRANQMLNASNPEMERMRSALMNRTGPGIASMGGAANFVQVDWNTLVPVNENYVDPIPEDTVITTTGLPAGWDNQTGGSTPYWITTTGTSYPATPQPYSPWPQSTPWPTVPPRT